MVSISAERSALNRVGGGLIRREQWGARHDYRSARAVTEPATQIFIHITVTNPSAYNSHAAHVRAIEAIGRSRFPNTGISYNRIVLFGVNRAYEGQPIGRRGAHTVNDHRRSTCNRWGAACPGHGGDLTAPSWNNNYTARAYAYGALTQHSVTDSVLDTFARAIADDIKAGFVRRDAKIHGHRCVSSKSCPGDHMWARMHELERRVNDYLEDDVTEEQMLAALERFHAQKVLTYNDKRYSRDEIMEMATQWSGSNANAIKYELSKKLDALLGQQVPRPDGEAQWSIPHALNWLMRAAAEIMQAQGVEVDEAALASELAALLLPDLREEVRSELADVDGVDEDAVATKIVARVGAKLSAPDA